MILTRRNSSWDRKVHNFVFLCSTFLDRTWGDKLSVAQKWLALHVLLWFAYNEKRGLDFWVFIRKDVEEMQLWKIIFYYNLSERVETKKDLYQGVKRGVKGKGPLKKWFLKIITHMTQCEGPEISLQAISVLLQNDIKGETKSNINSCSEMVSLLWTGDGQHFTNTFRSGAPNSSKL